MKLKYSLFACLIGLSRLAMAEPPLLIPVTLLGAAPEVDGDLAEWGKAGWVSIPVRPALDKADRTKYGMDPNDDQNQTGRISVQLKVGIVGERIFFALRYPDDSENLISKLWEWRGNKYNAGKQRADMLALRFHMSGDFDRSMLSNKDYTVDVWLWSAALTNPTGLAEDMSHHVTTRMLESAAEYEGPDKKTIYIKKSRDAGNAPYKLLRKPKENTGKQLPSFETSVASGSAADVAAKGRWKAGFWQLEFARKLNTGNADDTVFRPGEKILGQIAVFNQGYSEHKSVSELLLFDLSAIK